MEKERQLLQGASFELGVSYKQFESMLDAHAEHAAEKLEEENRKRPSTNRSDPGASRTLTPGASHDNDTYRTPSHPNIKIIKNRIDKIVQHLGMDEADGITVDDADGDSKETKGSADKDSSYILVAQLRRELHDHVEIVKYLQSVYKKAESDAASVTVARSGRTDATSGGGRVPLPLDRIKQLQYEAVDTAYAKVQEAIIAMEAKARELDEAIHHQKLRKHDVGTLLNVGTDVKVKWRDGLYYKAKIAEIESDLTVKVIFADGDRADNVPISDIHLIGMTQYV